MTDLENVLERAVRATATVARPNAPYADLLQRRNRTRRRSKLATVVVASLVAAAGFAGVMAAFRAPSAVDMRTPLEASVRGWPGPGPQPAGTYSWDPNESRYMSNRSAGSGTEGYPFGFELTMATTSKFFANGSPVTIDGYDGMHRERNVVARATLEEWVVQIQGTFVRIALSVPHRATDAKIAETHAIIDSIHVDTHEGEPGFRLLFDLPAGWEGDGRGHG
jgi:hypothetical protein